MTREDWNWIAGIFEGEGTACIGQQIQRRPYKVGKRIVVTITQKDTSMLYEVKRLMNIGSIHPGNRVHMWVIASRAARNFLINLRPFIRSERRKIQVDNVLKIDAEERAKGKASLIQSAKNRRNTKGQFS